MSTPSQGISGPSGRTGLQPSPLQPPSGIYAAPRQALTQMSQEQSMVNQIRKLTYTVETLLTLHEESSVTKGKIDALLRGLDKLGIGADDGVVVHKLRYARSNTVFNSLEQIKDKLTLVSNQLENVERMGSNQDTMDVPEMLDDIRDAVNDCQSIILAPSIPGEAPPPAPRACFGRGGLIEEIVSLAENLQPVALVGAGGIGKTSIALTVLHHDRIKKHFGGNRRFIRCDQFPSTLSHFLNQLSKVTGAGIENPEDLTRLIPFLSSKEMLVVLDNAESILDPQGTNSQEIYTAVEEMCRLDTVCLFITSRISTIPPDCEAFDIPTLSMESARDTFYRIYKSRERPGPVDIILRQLDFHPLSITLLSTVAHQNKWDLEELITEWDRRRTGVLQTEHKASFAAAIELSLASPMFQELGPDARGLLGVVAFFPQGIDKKNLEWLFPTVSGVTTIFDKFCILSLTYKNNGFITMLAPLRDYLRPKDPMSSPLLRTTKERYFTRLSVEHDLDRPGSRDAGWVVSEDVNIEHLLDIFTSIDAGSDDVWATCANFIAYLFWHKPRRTVLGPKIEGLADDHRFKPECLYQLSRSFAFVGSPAERRRLLSDALKLERERGNLRRAGFVLRNLSATNRMLGYREEGMRQAKEALGTYEQLDDAEGQATSLDALAWLLHEDGQLDAAEEAATRSISLLEGTNQEFQLCQSRRTLGEIYRSKGKRKDAILQFESALRLASFLSFHSELFWTHHSLAQLFLEEGRFDDAHAHIELAKSHTANNAYYIGRATSLHAWIWYRQLRFEDATSEALRAKEIFEKLGTSGSLEICNILLRNIEWAVKSRDTPDELDSSTRDVPFSTSTNASPSC